MMIDIIEKKVLEKERRRHLIVYHEIIHGIDFIEIIDNKNIILYFVESENKQKHPPELTFEELQLSLVTNSTQSTIEIAELTFDEVLYGFNIKLRDAININEETELHVKLNHTTVDRFFSHATVKVKDSLKQSKNKSHQSQQPNKKALPRLDYLSKDYQSFKKLINNELTYNSPEWEETNPSDMLIMLTEVMAYGGDYLSYFQDAVATEAYLFTARQQSSIKRHCRILDHRISSQLNSRCWVHFSVKEDQTIPRATALLCGNKNANVSVDLTTFSSQQPGSEVVFETMHELQAKSLLNEIEFYNWGVSSFFVAKGAQTFELKGKLPLILGDVLVISIKNSSLKKQAVRLLSMPTYGTDLLTGVTYTTVQIHPDDALLADAKQAIVYGNIALADQGQSIYYEPLHLQKLSHSYSSMLKYNNLVYAEHNNNQQFTRQSAAKSLQQDPYKAVPSLTVFETTTHEPPYMKDTLFEHKAEQWRTVNDFLNSTPYSKDISVEESENTVNIRFGNGEFGALPSQWRKFCVSYRIISTRREKIAAGTINQLCLPIKTDNINQVTNLTTASGGKPKEYRDITLKLAPHQHRQRLNLVLPQDYITKLNQIKEIKDTYCEESWNGTKKILNLYVYPHTEISQKKLQNISTMLATHQLINHRFHLKRYTAVLAHIKLSVSTAAHTNHNVLLILLQQCLGNGLVNSSSPGLFYADNFTFGVALYQSQVIQAAMSVDGVNSVQLHSFQRFDDYIGSERKNNLCEAIMVQGPEIITFADQQRQSLIEININGVDNA